MAFNKPAHLASSKKHQPKGLTILYEDIDILVVNKEAGLLTISTDSEKEKTAHFLLNDYVKKGNPRSKNRVFIVHRLDRETSGLLIFAKTEKAKVFLQENWKDFNKTYFAIIHGQLAEKVGEITSYLTENTAHRVYSTQDAEQGKFAKTAYQVLKETNKYSLLQIQLLTGRKHQIRVHFSEKGHAVLGDKMYGEKEAGIQRLALHSASIEFKHPFSKKPMVFSTDLPPFFNSLIH